MGFTTLADLEVREPVPGFRARFVHSDAMTCAYWTIDAGARLPEHSHLHEQIVNVLEGQLELTLAGETRVLDSGTVAVIPSNVPHAGRALAPCRVLDVFHPVRDDYR